MSSLSAISGVCERKILIAMTVLISPTCIFLLMASDRFSFMLGLSFYSLAKVIKLLKLVSLVLREERASGRLLRGSPTGPDLPDYQGHGIVDKAVYHPGKRKNKSRSLQKAIKRRSCIEALIGHMKNDGKLAVNYLKGVVGAPLNALLCAIGHNLQMLLAFIPCSIAN